MKSKINLLFISLLLITTFSILTACDKTDDPAGDFPSAGTVKDADGNKYNTVKIGHQVWTVENLKTTKYNDGTPIPNVTENDVWANLTTGAYCNYDNLESNAATYGRLYNWYVVNTGKLAPAGWHVPNDDEWHILEEYLITNGYNYDGTREENKIAKSLASKNGWEFSEYGGCPGNSAENNNSTGFSALPGGTRHYLDGYFRNISQCSYWWSSAEYKESGAYYQYLYCGDFILGSYHLGKENGFSVRLVKD